MDYENFLRSKQVKDPDTGIESPVVPGNLFDFQQAIVKWALRRGRAAIFAGTGLGKSFMELSWADAVAKHTGKPVLIFTPLAVAAQMIREGQKFGIDAVQCKDQSEVSGRIAVTNYQKIDHFDLSQFSGVVLDESSIVKHQQGKFRTLLIERCKQVPFRMAATATPAPNDWMELGNHAEFLGVMSYTDMLACFFRHDGGDTGKWIMKPWAEEKFWQWMASWSVMLQHPKDLGFKADGYDLPPLRKVEHTVTVDYEPSMETGTLFPMRAVTMSERLAARRDTVKERVELAAKITPHDRPFVWWCNLDAEADALVKAIPSAVQVSGKDKEDDKERKLLEFSEGKIRVLVTKPRIAGFGMNWQHCSDTGFVGLTDSFEQIYQAIRRFYRFGQTKPVTAHFIAAETEDAVVKNIQAKEELADRMARAMIEHMADLSSENIRGTVRQVATYDPQEDMRLPSFLTKG